MPPVPIQQLFAQALILHQAGRLSDAESIYRQILAAQPNHPEALHHLGIVAHQTGRQELAVDLIRQSLALDPSNFAAHSNLGETFRALSRPEEAIAHFRQALQLNPNSAQAHYNLAFVLKIQGQLQEAVAEYQRAVALKPDYVEAHNNLAGAFIELGLFQSAANASRRALEIRPDFSAAHYNLAHALERMGQLDLALESYRRALQFQPAFAEAHGNLGRLLYDLGRCAEALAVYRQALQIQPAHAQVSYNLGVALEEQGAREEALAMYRQALRDKPDYLAAANNLGNVLKDLGRLDEAVEAFHHALRIKPDSPETHNNLAFALRDRGQPEEALEALRQALRFGPESPRRQSNWIYSLQFHPHPDSAAIAAASERWNRQFADPLKSSWIPHTNVPDPERRLRIGYVSPDFREHPIPFFLDPLLKAHDRRDYEIHAYASVPRPDAVTGRLQADADVWHDVAHLNDEQLAQRIRDDEIDILVGLAMHSAGNRLLAFARRPAPVQGSWLAYAARLGADVMQFQFTDARIDPPEAAQEGATEIIRLPDVWCCYAPIAEFPPVGPLPARQNRVVTFGSLNQFAKINPALLHSWATLLASFPDSRLLIVCPHGRAAEETIHFFEAHGVRRERLELVAFGPWTSFVRLLQRVDLALDTFPVNGMTTTCHALWMGVPVITRTGASTLSRAGLSLMHALNLPELVARSEEEFIHIASTLAHDLDRLAGLRATLRSRMTASPLMDAPRFARHVEAAYRNLWKQWCRPRA